MTRAAISFPTELAELFRPRLDTPLTSELVDPQPTHQELHYARNACPPKLGRMCIYHSGYFPAARRLVLTFCMFRALSQRGGRIVVICEGRRYADRLYEMFKYCMRRPAMYNVGYWMAMPNDSVRRISGDCVFFVNQPAPSRDHRICYQRSHIWFVPSSVGQIIRADTYIILRPEFCKRELVNDVLSRDAEVMFVTSKLELLDTNVWTSHFASEPVVTDEEEEVDEQETQMEETE